MDFALCLEPPGLSRLRSPPPETGGGRTQTRNPGRAAGESYHAQLRRHRADRRARLCEILWRRMGRQEYVANQPEKRLVAFSGSDSDIARTRTRSACA